MQQTLSISKSKPYILFLEGKTEKWINRLIYCELFPPSRSNCPSFELLWPFISHFVGNFIDRGHLY